MVTTEERQALSVINKKSFRGGQALLPTLLENHEIDWSGVLASLADKGLIRKIGSTVQLTDTGREALKD